MTAPSVLVPLTAITADDLRVGDLIPAVGRVVELDRRRTSVTFVCNDNLHLERVLDPDHVLWVNRG